MMHSQLKNTLFWLCFSLIFAVSGIQAKISEESKYRGAKLYRQTLQNNPPYVNPKIQDYVNRVGQRIVAASDWPDEKFVFTVTDRPSVNAYALIGGYIFVDRGLLAYVNTEDQLAAVLAHEVAHIVARHSERRKRSAEARQALGNLASVMTYWYTGSQELSSLPSYINEAWIKGYGRKMELEADEIGVVYLVRAGYAQEAMMEVISLLKHQDTLQRRLYRDRNKRPPNYHGIFSTHQRNDKRLHEVLSSADRLPQTFGSIEPVGDYLSKIDGLAFGPSSDNGFDYKNTYYNRVEGFRVDFPDDWTTQVRGHQLIGYPLSSPENAYVQLQIRYLRGDLPEPESYARDSLGLRLENVNLITPKGFTGLIGNLPERTDTFEKKRVALLLDDSRAYIFSGKLTDERLLDDWLIAFDNMLSTLSRLPEDAGFQVAQNRLRIYTTRPGDSYVSLSPPEADRHLVDRLRLLNGDYPRGELGPGERIKLVR